MDQPAHRPLGMSEPLRDYPEGVSQLCADVSAALKLAARYARQHDPCKITLYADSPLVRIGVPCHHSDFI